MSKLRAAVLLAASVAWLGASPPPEAAPSPSPRCPAAAQPAARYESAAADPDADLDDTVDAALGASAAYDACAAFQAARGDAEALHEMQVRSAQYRYQAGRLYFLAEDYAAAHVQLNAARQLVAETIAWPLPVTATPPPGKSKEPGSRYRAEALAVRDAASALLAKIPVPTGISTAPARRPAGSAPP